MAELPDEPAADKDTHLRYCFSLALFLGLSCSVKAAQAPEFQACLAQLQQQTAARELSADTIDKVIPALEYQSLTAFRTGRHWRDWGWQVTEHLHGGG